MAKSPDYMSTHYSLVRGKVEPLLTGKPPPGNLLPSLTQWIAERFWLDTPFGIELDSSRFQDAERRLGVGVPFEQSTEQGAMDDCLERVGRSEDFTVRLLAVLLPSCSSQAVAELNSIFEAPGSKWEVVVPADGNARLSLRQSGPVAEAIQGIKPFSEPAYEHLGKALERLTRPGDPDPGVAYIEAVKAVEAAARPVLIPDDPLATLGKMIRAVRDKESKWGVVLRGETVADVIRRAEILWTTPHERHGSDDPDPPVTQEQAQAAFDLAIGLVDYFARRLIYRVPGDAVHPAAPTRS